MIGHAVGTLGVFYRGLAEGRRARLVRGYPEWFYTLGQGEAYGIPTQLWIRSGGLSSARLFRLHHLWPRDLCHARMKNRRPLLGNAG